MKENPISLVGMRHAFGERIVSNEEIETKYSLPKNWVFEKTGKEKGHAWDNGPDSPTEASLGCFKSLLVSTGIDTAKIKAVFGTTNPITIDGKTEEKSLTQKFVERADLSEDVYVSDEGFACGGTAIGVESMCTWLQKQTIGTYAVYVTQDWPTKMVQDRNVEALFSDAVSVSLWTNSPTEGVMEVIDIFSANSTISDESLGIVGGFWKMNGKEVSEAASKVPALVAEKLGINLQEYDIVPHQPNPKLLETIEKIYDVQMHKQVAVEHGNPTCSGAFIALEKAMEDRSKGIGTNLQKDILVLPFGAGGVGGFVLRDKTA
jgi:3-oxoacyl-[acyl-carrier-protein] synthase III